MKLKPRKSLRESKPPIAQPPAAIPDSQVAPQAESKPRPQLQLSKPNAPIPEPETPDLTANSPQMRDTQPVPYDNYDLDNAELQDRTGPKETNPYLKKKNSKLKSGLLAMLRGAGDQANRALASGARNPLAYAIGGGFGGLGAGAIHDSWDEEEENDRRTGELRGNMGFELEKRNREAEVNYNSAKPAIEAAKVSADREKNRSTARTADADRIVRVFNDLPEFDPNSNDPNVQRMVEQAGTLGISLPKKTRVDKVQMQVTPDGRVFLHDGAGNVKEANDPATGQPYNVSRPHDLKIPDEMLRGNNDNKLKDDATAEVLSKPEYHQKYVRPEILAQFKDEAGITKAIKAGQLRVSDVFTDPSKGPMFQRDLAATYSRKAAEAQEFDRAVKMTSTDAGTTRIAYSDFEQTWKNFQADVAAASGNPKKQAAIRRQFEQALSQVRLVGQ